MNSEDKLTMESDACQCGDCACSKINGEPGSLNYVDTRREARQKLVDAIIAVDPIEDQDTYHADSLKEYYLSKYWGENEGELLNNLLAWVSKSEKRENKFLDWCGGE